VIPPSLRAIVLQVHRWAGLTVGLVAVYLALTGLAMVFRSELRPLTERELRPLPSGQEAPACSARLPLDELVARARALRPGVNVAQIEASEGGLGATIVRFVDGEGIYVNSCSGAVIGRKQRWAGFFDTAEQLHRLQFIDNVDATELALGSVSFVVALLLVGGGLLVVWPPSLKALAKAARFRLHLRGAAFDVNLHRTLGMYVAMVLLLSTVTSLTFTFEWARHAIFAATGSPVPAKKPKIAAAAGAPTLPAETFMAATLKALPDARDIQILFPRRKGDAVEVQVLGRDAPHGNARSFVYMNPSTAEIVRFEPYAAASVGIRVYRWLGALHQGQVGGLAMQVVLFAGILGVPVLAFTGVRGYLRRKLAARGARSPVPASRSKERESFL
jgi:uncharacterized iron-regulated membrane protein